MIAFALVLCDGVIKETRYTFWVEVCMIFWLLGGGEQCVKIIYIFVP